jgi:hypothetical protein
MLVTTVGKGYNRTTSVNSAPNQKYSPNIKQNLKTEIDLLFILSPLPLVLVFGVLCWSILLQTVPLVIILV